MNENVLCKVGMSEQEIKIYLALLSLDSCTATKVATEVGIDRATTYRFLSSLIDKGFVSYHVLNNVKYFSAAHPSKIIEDLKEKIEGVKDIMPDLENLMKSSMEETKVELYKGKEGLKTIMKDIINEKKPYTFIGEIGKFFTELEFYVYQWLKQVDKFSIKGKLICNEESEFIVARNEKYRLISKDFISQISTFTYGSKTALFVWAKPLYGIVIESKDVTNSNVSLFEFLWEIAKEPGKKDLEKRRRKELNIAL